MDNLRKQFGKRLRILRRVADLTQEQLAAKSEISVDFISMVERGISAPSFENIEKLAKALEVDIKELFSFHEKN